jgi:hypothetical protein
VYDSTPAGSGASTGWEVLGGTSAASPILAAEFGLAAGARGVSYPAATLFSHFGEGGALYDVVSGSNGSCSGTTACNAAPGYDAPTGVGSPVGLTAFEVSGSPANTSAPSVSGTAEQGQTLTASTSEWSGSPTSYSYQWEMCNASGASCSTISNATSSTLTLPASAVGSTVRVVVSASNASGGGTPAQSAQTTKVESSVPHVASVSPASAITGSTVTIIGNGLTGTTQVRFGSLSATFKVISSKEIEATVPNGATAGTVSITTAPVRAASSAVKFTPSLSRGGGGNRDDQRPGVHARLLCELQGRGDDERDLRVGDDAQSGRTVGREHGADHGYEQRGARRLGDERRQLRRGLASAAPINPTQTAATSPARP